MCANCPGTDLARGHMTLARFSPAIVLKHGACLHAACAFLVEYGRISQKQQRAVALSAAQEQQLLFGEDVTERINLQNAGRQELKRNLGSGPQQPGSLASALKC